MRADLETDIRAASAAGFDSAEIWGPKLRPFLLFPSRRRHTRCSRDWSSDVCSSDLFTWLIGYGALLGPVAGIMIADYFVVRRGVLNVNDLYKRHGIYEYSHGINWLAV